MFSFSIEVHCMGCGQKYIQEKYFPIYCGACASRNIVVRFPLVDFTKGEALHLSGIISSVMNRAPDPIGGKKIS